MSPDPSPGGRMVGGMNEVEVLKARVAELERLVRLADQTIRDMQMNAEAIAENLSAGLLGKPPPPLPSDLPPETMAGIVAAYNGMAHLNKVLVEGSRLQVELHEERGKLWALAESAADLYDLTTALLKALPQCERPGCDQLAEVARLGANLCDACAREIGDEWIDLPHAAALRALCAQPADEAAP